MFIVFEKVTTAADRHHYEFKGVVDCADLDHALGKVLSNFHTRFREDNAVEMIQFEGDGQRCTVFIRVFVIDDGKFKPIDTTIYEIMPVSYL